MDRISELYWQWKQNALAFEGVASKESIEQLNKCADELYDALLEHWGNEQKRIMNQMVELAAGPQDEPESPPSSQEQSPEDAASVRCINSDIPKMLTRTNAGQTR